MAPPTQAHHMHRQQPVQGSNSSSIATWSARALSQLGVDTSVRHGSDSVRRIKQEVSGPGLGLGSGTARAALRKHIRTDNSTRRTTATTRTARPALATVFDLNQSLSDKDERPKNAPLLPTNLAPGTASTQPQPQPQLPANSFPPISIPEPHPIFAVQRIAANPPQPSAATNNSSDADSIKSDSFDPNTPPPKVKRLLRKSIQALQWTTPQNPPESVDWWAWTWVLLTFCCTDKMIAFSRNWDPIPKAWKLWKEEDDRYAVKKKENNPQTIQAWREKVASCILIGMMMILVAFLTVGLQFAFCPTSLSQSASAILSQNDHKTVGYHNNIVIFGRTYDYNQTKTVLAKAGVALNADFISSDLTPLFIASACAPFGMGPQITGCSVSSKYGGAGISASPCLDPSIITMSSTGRAYFSWDDIAYNSKPPHTLMVFNGIVLNLTAYLGAPTSSQIFGSNDRINQIISDNVGFDSTRAFSSSYDTISAANCLAQRYSVGFVDQIGVGCSANQFIQGAILGMIAILISIRFVMAFIFHWFISGRIVASKNSSAFRNKFLPQRRQRTTTIRQPPPRAPPTGQNGGAANTTIVSRLANLSQLETSRRHVDNKEDPYVIMLVTCYSESIKEIEKTVRSLATTDYADHKKLLFLVADGLVTGKDQVISTPDVVIGLIRRLNGEEGVAPEEKSYLAIADGRKQHNMAQVYAGHYIPKDDEGKVLDENARVPIVGIVKCGTPEERGLLPGTKREGKPGNRGKRDSQMLLMNFLSSVSAQPHARMTPLDYDLACKIKSIEGTCPSEHSLVLMVDADTAVHEDSLFFMVQAMVNDPKIMGLCGETRIANKTDSFVTKIQVFEYYISHHLGKAFESVFGGVTCLPGCFSMYRIRGETLNGDLGNDSETGKEFVPILIEPEIIDYYKEFIVDSLHKKNLLLLGEDRYLTTLMLSRFPKRRLIFVPQAMCETTVPHTFKQLFSQRRRWINSTIHNLLELLRVDNLCGIFCLSMKFVILLELIGTVVLPVAVSLMFVLLISAMFTGPSLPLYMLLVTLLLPGVLILCTTFELEYIGWMFVYLGGLPVWNFALPLYAFWNFDDFSWGETRRVAGEVATTGNHHGENDGQFKIGDVKTYTWEEWKAMSNPNSEELSNEPGDVTNMSMQDDVTKIRQRIDINDDGRPNTRNSMYANKSRRGSMISMSTPTVKTGSTVYHTPGSSPAPQSSNGVGRNEEYNDEGVVGVSLLTPENMNMAILGYNTSVPVLQPRQPPQHPNTTQNISTIPYNHYYPQHTQQPQQQLSLGQYQQPAFNPYNSSYYQLTAHAYASTYGYDASHFTQVPIQPTSTYDKSQSSSNTSSNTSESSTPPLRRFESHSIPTPPSQDDSGRSSLLDSRSEPEPTRGMDSFLVALRSGSQVSHQQVSGEAEVTAVAHRVETVSVSSLSNRTAKAVHASRNLPRPNPRQPERQKEEESELESSKSFANFLPNHSILHYQAPRVALGADSQDKSILADESQSYIDERSNADQSVQHEESMNKSFLKFFKSGGSKNGSIRMKFATGLESIRGKRKDTNSSSGTSSVVGEEAVGTRGVSGRGPPPPPSLTSRDGSVVSSQNSSLHQQSKGNGSAQFQTYHYPQDAQPVQKEPQDVEQIIRVNSDHVSSRTTQSSNLRRSYNQVSSPAHSAKSVDSSDPSQETPRAPKREIAQDTTPPPVLRPSPRGPGREVPRRMTVEDIQQHQDVLASTKNRLYEQTDLQPPPIPPKRSPLRKSSTDPRLGSNTVSSVSHTPVRQEPQYPQERLQTQHISSASRQPQPRPLRADASLPNLIQKVEAFKDISTSSSGLSPNDFSVSSSGRQHRHSTPAQYASTDNSDYSASELESCVVDYSILEVEGDFSQTTTDTPSFAISPNNKNRPVPEYSIDEDSSVFEEESQDCSVSRTEDAYQTADEDSAIHYELPLPPPTSVVSRSSLSNAPVNNRPSASNRKRKVLPVVPSAPDNTIAYGNSSRPSPPRSQTQSTPQRNSTARNNYEMSLTPVSAERFLAGLKAVSRKPSKF